MKQTRAKTVMDSDIKNGGFLEVVNQEKHERLARNALHDLFTFYDQLEVEIGRFSMTPSTPHEQQILERMTCVKGCYHNMMNGFRELDAEKQQHEMVRFSDALVDLMKLLNRHKVQ